MSAAPSLSRRFLMQRPIARQLLDRYSLTEEVLGQGSEAIVLRAVQRASGRPVAIKFIFKENSSAASSPQSQPQPLPMEIRVLSRVQHPNIIQYIEHFEDDSFYYLVLELAGPSLPWSEVRKMRDSVNWNERDVSAGYGNDLLPASATASSTAATTTTTNDNGDETDDGDLSDGGVFVPLALPAIPLKKTSRDLFECLEKFGPFSEDRARHIFAQIVDAMSYLHDNNIYHRDPKDENILISDDLTIKVIDLGSALIMPSNLSPADHFVHGTFGTSVYNAPETIRSATHPCTRSCDNDGEEVDIVATSPRSAVTAEGCSGHAPIAYPPSPALSHEDDEDATTDDRTTLASQSMTTPTASPAPSAPSAPPAPPAAASKPRTCAFCYRPAPADMWALGVLLYVMLNVSIPFDTAWDVLHRPPKPFARDDPTSPAGQSATKPLSPEVRQLVAGLLDKNADKRWDMATVKQSAWLRS
ncbi:hypothetical protein RI367_000195 [Sorochytrium milnesiophthora]